jgi:hypothetical protein
MAAPGSFSPEEFGAAFSRFLEWINDEEGPEGDGSPFASMLQEHFGADPSLYPVTAESIAPYDLPNLQLALDAYLERPGTQHTLVGFGGAIEHFDISLSGLVHDIGFGIKAGPVRHTATDLEHGRSISCVTLGLFLISGPGGRLAALVTQGQQGFDRPGVRLEVLAPEEEGGRQFLAAIRELMHEHNVYRGKVLAMTSAGEMFGEGLSVEFKSLAPIAREDIVLPEGVLETIELHTVEFARHTDVLRAGGRHLRRGLLMHGRPGTGKTLTASYLISRLEGRTVVILSGGGLGLIGAACALVKDLQPGVVILEDIDLVAYERSMGMGTTPLLFELLNEMDGIGEDADVIFLMTTNRADILEPALAARPGRVDQAVEMPLPDAEGRSRLLDLFCRGLEVKLEDRDSVIEATDEVSPAFLRELVRKAALHAAAAGDDVVQDRHFASALAMLEEGGQLMRSLLGGGGDDAVSRLGDENGGGWIGGDIRFEDDE